MPSGITVEHENGMCALGDGAGDLGDTTIWVFPPCMT